MSARVALGRTRGALLAANCRLVSDADFYAGVRAELGRGENDAAENATDCTGRPGRRAPR